MTAALREGLVWLTLLAVPLSTAGMEVGLGLLFAWACCDGRARAGSSIAATIRC